VNAPDARPDDRAPAPPRQRGGCLGKRSLIGLVISAVLLYFAFRNIHFRDVGRRIADADPLLFGLATVLATFVFWIRAWRWKSILEPVRPGISFRNRFAATTIGFMGNNVLPMRIGEFMRAYALSRLEPVPIVSAFSSLVLERLLDAVFIVSVLFISMTLPGFPGFGVEGTVYTTAARGVALFVVVAFLLLGGFVVWPEPAVRITEALARRLPRAVRRPLVDSLEAFLAGVGVLRRPRLISRAAFWTAVLWLVSSFSFWVAFRAFDMQLSFTAALFFQCVIALAVSVPSGPAFFGPFEAAAVTVLAGMWGMDPSHAVAMAGGFHIAGFIPVTLIGIYYARTIKLSLREVEESEETIEAAVERTAGLDPDQRPRP
jgi:uncharacterized protein (TIRG00374 family)